MIGVYRFIDIEKLVYDMKFYVFVGFGVFDVVDICEFLVFGDFNNFRF